MSSRVKLVVDDFDFARLFEEPRAIDELFLAYLDKTLEEREVWAAHLAVLQGEATDELQFEPDRLPVLLG